MSTVFLDVDSQLDFLFPSGALYAPGAEQVAPAIARLNRFAASRGIPVVSTMDAHPEDDPEFSQWPPHCVAGTHGQRKAEETLLARRILIPNRACEWDLAGAEQIIIEKQHVDAFLSVNLEPALQALGAGDCVVYGLVTEVCVLLAARGLLQSGRKVTVVSDAIQALTPEGGAAALREIQALGGTLATADEVCSPQA